MDNCPINYERWSEKRGGETWIECPFFVADEVRRYESTIIKVADEMGKAIARKLFESGAKTGIPNVYISRDIVVHGWVFNADVKAENECLPEQYTYMAYNMWRRERSARVEWENKSLWQYIKHWLKRLLNRCNEVDSDIEL